MRAYERFLAYAKVSTPSADGTGKSPSTDCQWTLARLLEKELKELGLSEVQVSEYGVVTAVLPATPGQENAPALGLIAHMDTSPAFSGEGVRPLLHPDYKGGDICLPEGCRVIKVSEFPVLETLKGRTLITADGSTLLGADDKAGIAEIMTLCETLQKENLPHGKLCVAFTPDEEVGQGVDHFDVPAFGATYAYTLDGDLEGGIEYENFNAAAAKIDIDGVSVHPGSAKGIMENALLLAAEVNAKLPAEAIPGRTEGYEGFFHWDILRGDAAACHMEYIIRDHDGEKFKEKKELLRRAVDEVGAAHPTARLSLELKDSYYNMAGQLKDCMHLIDNAKAAAEKVGLTPRIAPIRGGTDGARLSYMGLPCPNLGTGGFNFHGPYECVTVEGMDSVVEMLKALTALYTV